MAKKTKAKKTAHKSTSHVSSSSKRHNHLLKDHPHFWWLILIFLAMCMYFLWRYQQNQTQIDVLMMDEPVYMETSDVTASPSAAY